MSRITACSIEPKEQSRFIRPYNLSCLYNVPLGVTRQVVFFGLDRLRKNP